MVDVVTADGLGTIPDEDAAQFVQSGGGRLATPQESAAFAAQAARESELQAQFGGVGGQAATFGAGVVDGATFGLGTAAAAGLGFGRDIADLREANPNAFTAGNVTGAIAPVLLSGGSGAVAKGAATLGAPALGVARLGEGAAAIARTAVGGVESALVRRAVPLAVQGAVEGAAFGMGHEITEAALVPNAELTAEKLLAGAAHGAGWGLAGGAAFGGIEHLASKAATKTSELIAKTGGRNALADFVDKEASDMAFRAAGGNKKLAKRAERYAGGVDEVTRVWTDEAPKLVGAKSFKEMSRESLDKAAELGMRQNLPEDVLARFNDDVVRTGAAPRALDVMDKLQTLRAEMADGIATKSVANKIDEFVEKYTALADNGAKGFGATDARMDLKDLYAMRREVDGVIGDAGWGKTTVPAIKKLRDLVNAEIKSVGEKATGESGVFLEAWKTVNKNYQAYAMLKEAAQNGMTGASANRFFSLTDNMAAKAAGVGGALLGGGIPGALGAAAVGGLANHWMRTRGAFIAADAARGVAQKLRGVNLAAHEVDSRVAQGLKGFLSKAETTAVRGETEALNKRFERKTAAVRAIASDPMKQSAYVMARVGRIDDAAPATMAAAQRSAARTTEYLASTMPKPRVPKGSLMPRSQAVPPTSTEMSAWLRRERAANDPLSLVDDMKRGTLTPESVDAVKATSPALFEQMRRQALAYVEERDVAGKPLDYGQRVQLGVLFGVPTDATLEPEFIRSIQETYPVAGTPESNGTSAPSGTGRPIRLQTSAASASEAIEGR